MLRFAFLVPCSRTSRSYIPLLRGHHIPLCLRRSRNNHHKHFLTHPPANRVGQAQLCVQGLRSFNGYCHSFHLVGIESSSGNIADVARESQTIRVHKAPPKSSPSGRFPGQRNLLDLLREFHCETYYEP